MDSNLKKIINIILSHISTTVNAIGKCSFCIIEYYKKMSPEMQKRITSGILIAIAIIFLTIKGGVYYQGFIMGICILMVIELLGMLENLKSKNINFYMLYKKWGLFYIFTTCISIMLIREETQGLKVTLWMFASVFSLDIFAYFGGKKFGTHKLAPEISPGKTYEGAICGTAGSIIVSVIVYKFFHKADSILGLRIESFIVLSFAVAVLAQIGDISESWLKRACGVKDSGSILPGHGGVLDRFDSIMMAAPFIYVVLFINRGILF